MTEAWALEDDTCDDGVVRKYPFEKPYTQRDQGVRGADGTILVVLSDVVDVLNSELAVLEMQARAYNASLVEAEKLLEEAEELPWDDNYNWVDSDEDEYASEKLMGILQEAEQIDLVNIDWNGDAGTVTVTLSEYWEEFNGD